MSATEASKQTTTEDPEPLLLAGQAAAPPGPVDMTMMYVMHHAFRRELHRFAAAAEHTPAGDTATWAALADRWAFFGEVLHGHHTGEDAGIWPYLLERADQKERATLEAMEAEHERIDPLLDICSKRFAVLADIHAEPRHREETRAALAVRLAETREVLGQHLAHEEAEALVILQRHMSPADWERLEAEHFHGQHSIGFMLFVVPWIADGLPGEALNRAFGLAGQAMRVVWWVGLPRYRRATKRALRYLPAGARS
ncbi:hemerythrin domain-containing protein [Nocardioides insulae]|uniref:hemerythrin domain-containing protein n=1 Tax=Nocardioides insulae TaxID=394734 RepID=UPI000415A9B6|nr:hemerythrin domain-containing protein [Nocardioides insulae]